jgi:hypothetical protein
MLGRQRRHSHGSRARRRGTDSLRLEALEGRALLSSTAPAGPMSLAYGTPLPSAQLDATADVPGTFIYSPPAGTILTAGMHTLSVTFIPDDSIDYATVTATTTITVAKALPTVGVVGGGHAGSPIPVTATVAGVVAGVDSAPAASLEGVLPALTYYAGAAATGSPLDGPPTTVGTYTVVASFPGSTDYVAATAQAIFVIAPANPAIAWAAPAPIVYGTALGSSQLAATADVPGRFAYDPAPGTVLDAGVHTLSVTFTPLDAASGAAATATTSIVVTKATPTVIVGEAGGVYSGAEFAATATVVGVGGRSGPTLEGISPIVTYYAGATAAGPPLAGPPTEIGTYTAIAAFPGGADYAGASSRPVTFDIAAPPAAVALGSSAESAAFGQSVTLTATVSPGPPEAGIPTGTMTFYDGAAVLDVAPIDASGRAVLTIRTLGLGDHAITAVYSGDARSSGGRSGSLSESVTPADTQILLVPHATLKGKRVASLSLTAEVEPLAPGGGVPTGVATFMLRNKPIGTASLIGGQASLTVKPGSVLGKPITVMYGGGAGYRAASLTSPPLSTRSLVGLARAPYARRAARISLGAPPAGDRAATRVQHEGGRHPSPPPAISAWHRRPGSGLAR